MTQWSDRSSKPFGWACLVFSPILFAMAAVSTVESTTAYHVQLAIFSAASIATFVCGVAAITGASWASRGPVVASALGGIYFFGSGVLLAAFALRGLIQFGGSALLFPLLAAAVLAAIGLGLLGIARKLSHDGVRR